MPTDKINYSLKGIDFIEDTAINNFVALDSFKQQQKQHKIVKQTEEDDDKMLEIKETQKEQYGAFLNSLQLKEELSHSLKAISEQLYSATQLTTLEPGTIFKIVAF